MQRATPFILAGSLALLQVFLGGVRLVWALPCYLLLAVAGFGALAYRRSPFVRPDRFCLVTTFALAGYLGVRVFLSPVPMLARPDLFTVLAGLTVYLVCALVLSETQSRLKVLTVLLAIGFVHVAIAIAQVSTQQNFMLLPGIFRPDYGFRGSGFYVSPNQLAVLLGMIGTLSLSICCWSRVELHARALAFYGFVACLVGIAITGSRVGYYSTTAALALFGLLSAFFATRFNRPHLFGLAMATAVLLTAIVAAALAFIVNSEIFEKNLRHVYDPSRQSYLFTPAAQRQHALSPIFGTGAGTFLYHGREFAPPELQVDPQHVHQEYRELLAEYGWFGALLGAAFLVAHLRSAARGVSHILERRLSPTVWVVSNELALLTGAICAGFLILVQALRDFPFHLPANALLAAFLFSILANPTVDSSRRGLRRPLPRWVLALAPAVAVVLLLATVWRLPSEFLAERARRALRDHAHADAVRFATLATRLDAAHADAHFYHGDAARRLALETIDPAQALAHRREAAQALERGLQAFPQDVRLLLALGQVRDDLGENSAADELFDRALAAAPQSALVHSACAIHWHRQRQFGRARELYLRAQRLGETLLSSAGLRDLERDEAVARSHRAFADLLPDWAITD